MHLKLQTDYALRTLIYLAHFGGISPVDDLAGSYGVSREHLVKVVQQLARFGFVRTKAGRGGGVQLALPAEEIDVADVVGRFEGRSEVLDCVLDPSVCVLEPGCRLRRQLMDAEEAFYATLTGTSVADLVRRPHPKHGLSRLGAS